MLFRSVSQSRYYEDVAPANAVQVVFRFEISGIGTTEFTAFELSHISNVDTISANSVTAGAILAGSVNSDKIAANAITSDKIFAGAITADKIQAGAITTDKLDALAVTAAKIAANAISADKIQANAIIASKLAVGDFTNLVPDSNLEDPNCWTNTSGWIFGTSGSAFRSQNWAYLDLSNQTSTYLWSKPWSVEAGESYFVSAQARANASGDTIYLRIALSWLDSSNNTLGAIQLIPNPTANPIPSTATTYETSGVAPYGAVRAMLGYVVAANSTGRVFVGSPVSRLKNNGKLIVDGAIKASHMSANSVTAGVISAGAIDAAALFVDGVITAAKLNVNQLSAISANLGSITAGSLNIGTAGGDQFIVQANGKATLRSGTTGARMVLSNNRLDVYDASGTLRVRIGEL